MEIKLVKFIAAHPECVLQEINHGLNQGSIQSLAQIAHINTLLPSLLSLKNGHYTITQELDWLDQHQLTTMLIARDLAYQVILCDSLPSTNSYALNNIHRLADKTIISCDWQFAGRGRFDRHWLTTIARDITVSVVYHFSRDFNLALLPLVSAIAINRLLKNHAIPNHIKWPNDIYVAQTKVGGILVENRLTTGQNRSVIGIGLANLTQGTRNNLVVELIQSLDNLINEFKLFGFALIRREWLDNCGHLKRKVKIMRDGQLLEEGIHTDISESGELIIRTATGNKTYSNSAVSLVIE